MKTILRYLSADSPLGPVASGLLTGVLFVGAVVAVAGIVLPPIAWLLSGWWQWWLP